MWKQKCIMMDGERGEWLNTPETMNILNIYTISFLLFYTIFIFLLTAQNSLKKAKLFLSKTVCRDQRHSCLCLSVQKIIPTVLPNGTAKLDMTTISNPLMLGHLDKKPCLFYQTDHITLISSMSVYNCVHILSLHCSAIQWQKHDCAYKITLIQSIWCQYQYEYNLNPVGDLTV